MTRLGALFDHVAARVGLAMATYKLGLLTLEVTSLRAALEHEREEGRQARDAARKLEANIDALTAHYTKRPG